MKKIRKPFECDFFSIYEENGQKHIHIHGYFYEGGTKVWHITDCIWLMLPLAEFIDGYKNGGADYINELFESVKQTSFEVGPTKAAELFNTYYDGKTPDKELKYSEITIETKVGNYFTKGELPWWDKED